MPTFAATALSGYYPDFRLLNGIRARPRRRLVADRGWPRQAVRTKPFWTPGQRGLD